MFAAGMLETPEVALAQSEAEQLAQAIRGVTDLYVTSIDPRVIAWGNLMMVCGMIYGPRIYTIMKKQPKKLTVVPIRAESQANGTAAAQPINTPSQMYGADFGVRD